MSQHPPVKESPLETPRLPGDIGSAILVVDEDPAFRLGLRTFLREYVGYDRVFAVGGGAEALDFVRADPSIKVVVLARFFPDMDGFELLEALKGDAAESRSRALAAIMIAAPGEEGAEERFFSHGGASFVASRFLAKPVSFEILEKAILSAHGEVLAAERPLEEPAAAGEGGATALPSALVEELSARVGEQSRRIGELEREVRAQRSKWRTDFALLGLAVLLFWLASHFGLGQRLAPVWQKTLERVEEVRSQFMGPDTDAARRDSNESGDSGDEPTGEFL